MFIAADLSGVGQVKKVLPSRCVHVLMMNPAPYKRYYATYSKSYVYLHVCVVCVCVLLHVSSHVHVDTVNIYTYMHLFECIICMSLHLNKFRRLYVQGTYHFYANYKHRRIYDRVCIHS